MSRSVRRALKRVEARRAVPAGGVRADSSAGWVPGNWGSGVGLFPVSEDNAQRGFRPRLDRDSGKMTTSWRFRAMLSDSRYIYSRVGQVNGSVHSKANYAVGQSWIPQYKGTNSRFKRAFTEVMKRWMPSCDVRGAPFNFQKSVWTGSVKLDVDGDFFILLTEDPETKAPRLQFIEAHRINSPLSERTVATGQYQGKLFLNGVVYDELNRPLAYNLLPPETPYGYQPVSAEYNFLPASSVIHVCDPCWFTQARGVPCITHGILDWYDLEEIRDAEKTATKVNSRLTLVETNDTGRADLASALAQARAGGDVSAVDATTKIIANGEIRYLRANSGHKIESHSSNRPSDTFIPFLDHIARSAHMGMDWPIEMHDMSKIGGAAVRAVVSQVQRSIARRQEALWQPFHAAVLYAVAAFMKRGDLPFATDWDNVEFSLPAQFSVDVGRDSDNRRQDVAMGIRGIDDVFAEEGEGDHVTVFRKRAQIEKDLQAVAAEFGIPPERIFNPAAASQPALMSLQHEPDADDTTNTPTE